jgi:hypothetical protein
MLFLFRGKHGPLVRTLVGTVLLALGLLLQGWLILIAIGAVLLVWGAAGLAGALRLRHRRSPRVDGRQP